MPDPDPTPQPDPSWVVRALLVCERIARTLAPTVAAALALWSVMVSKSNQTKIETVEARQVEVKDDLETKAQKERKAIEVNLRSSWKYLESLAADSGKQSDKDNAAAAKKVLDDFLAHNGN